MSASILLVDDEPATQEVLGLALRAEGYRVATASSGAEAFRRLARQEFDVVLSDIVMPDASGLDVLERSRSLHPQAAVILMTAHATVESAIRALRQGACDYLEKPFPLDELRERLRQLVQDRAAAPAAPAMVAGPPPDGGDDLPGGMVRAAPTAPGADLREAVRLFERRHVLDVLVASRFDKRAAARELGISLASLYRKLALEPPGDPPPA